MSERRMAALVGEGDQHIESPGSRTRILRTGSQHTESPGRKTRISRAHLTGSLHSNQSTENPILLVGCISLLVQNKCCNHLAKDMDQGVRQTYYSSTLPSRLLESRSTMSLRMVVHSRWVSNNLTTVDLRFLKYFSTCAQMDLVRTSTGWGGVWRDSSEGFNIWPTMDFI